MDRDFIQERIAATKAEIVAVETAVSALTSGGVQTYSLDTGQSKQSVTRLDLSTLHKNLDSLYNRLATLQARLSGGSIIARPSW